jgi:Fe-S cluster biogenesis protein NfuA
MKMGVEKTLRSYFPNLTEISAVDASSLLSPTLNMLKVVNDALQKILPAVRNLKGEVSVQDVNDWGGDSQLQRAEEAQGGGGNGPQGQPTCQNCHIYRRVGRGAWGVVRRRAYGV